MRATTEREEARRLGGLVQIDDACLRGEFTYLGGKFNVGKAGRGSANKQVYVAAVESNEALECPRFAVLEPIPTFDVAAVTDFAQRRLTPEAEVYADGLAAFRCFVDAAHAHSVLETEGGRAATEVRGARWVNIVLSNVKRALDGVYQPCKQPRMLDRVVASTL